MLFGKRLYGFHHRTKYVLGPFGLPVGYAVREHALPYRVNTSYRKMLRFRFATSNSETVRKFVRKYMEKKVFQERWNRM